MSRKKKDPPRKGRMKSAVQNDSAYREWLSVCKAVEEKPKRRARKKH